MNRHLHQIINVHKSILLQKINKQYNRHHKFHISQELYFLMIVTFYKKQHHK